MSLPAPFGPMTLAPGQVYAPPSIWVDMYTVRGRMEINRNTPSSSLNSLSTASSLDVVWDCTLDNGVTWQSLVHGTVPAGGTDAYTYIDTSIPYKSIPSDSNRKVRVKITCNGPSSISFAGTLYQYAS